MRKLVRFRWAGLIPGLDDSRRRLLVRRPRNFANPKRPDFEYGFAYCAGGTEVSGGNCVGFSAPGGGPTGPGGNGVVPPFAPGAVRTPGCAVPFGFGGWAVPEAAPAFAGGVAAPAAFMSGL